MNVLNHGYTRPQQCPSESAKNEPSCSEFGHRTTENVNASCFCLRQFADHLMTSREADQQRLAGNIHDELGQNLLALRIDVSMLHARTTGTHPRLNRKAATMLHHIDVALANAREIINKLHPPILTLGLLASIEWKIGEFERHQRIPCALHIEGRDSDYAPYDNRTLPLIKILHESLTNVARHANASHVHVTLASDSRKLNLAVSDDGIGIQRNQLSKKGAFGLIWMRERIGALGGTFVISASTQRKGTALTISIPR